MSSVPATKSLLSYGPRTRSLLKVLFEQRPIVGLPSSREMVAQALGESRMVEHEMCASALHLELELHNGIRPCWPINDAPHLHYTLIGNQFHVPAHDVPTEQRKRPANGWNDFGWSPRERAELFAVQQCLIQPLRSHLKIQFLMDGDRIARCARTGTVGGSSLLSGQVCCHPNARQSESDAQHPVGLHDCHSSSRAEVVERDIFASQRSNKAFPPIPGGNHGWACRALDADR